MPDPPRRQHPPGLRCYQPPSRFTADVGADPCVRPPVKYHTRLGSLSPVRTCKGRSRTAGGCIRTAVVATIAFNVQNRRAGTGPCPYMRKNMSGHVGGVVTGPPSTVWRARHAIAPTGICTPDTWHVAPGTWHVLPPHSSPVTPSQGWSWCGGKTKEGAFRPPPGLLRKSLLD